MRRLIAMRLVRLVVTLLVVTFLTSIMFELLPGDPALSLISADTFNVTPERIEAARKELNLDKPVPVRFGMWLGMPSPATSGRRSAPGSPCATRSWDRLPVTLQLMVMAQIFAIGFALLVAPIAALPPGQVRSTVSRRRCRSGCSRSRRSSAALLLIYMFAVRLHLAAGDGVHADHRGPGREHQVVDPARPRARAT